MLKIPKTELNDVDTIELATSVIGLCSIGNERFTATVHVAYSPCEQLMEFVAFEGWLRYICEEAMTIEELCARVALYVNAELQPHYVVVRVDAETRLHGDVTAFKYMLEDVDDEESDLDGS